MVTVKKIKLDFKEAPVLERQFEDRYGRDVKITRAVVLTDDKLISHAVARINFQGTEYDVVEYMKKDQTTDYVLAGRSEDLRKYKDYLQAEVYVADLIGKQLNGVK